MSKNYIAAFKKFEDIKAWQKAREFCKEIFIIMQDTELSKDYKLKDQINASGGSIMDNIAEGFGRGANTEFIKFLEISHASACESQSQLYRILDRDYIDQKLFDRLYNIVDEVKKMLIALTNYLSKSIVRGPKFKYTDTQGPTTQNSKPKTQNSDYSKSS